MKNLKNVILNAGMIIAGILMYVFMACANVSTVGGSANLFDFMKEGVQESNQFMSATGFNLAVVAGYFIAIFAAIMIVVAIVNLLCDFGVIKNVKIAKILNIVNMITSILVAIFALLALIGCAVYCNDVSILTKTTLGWAAIVNLIVGVLAAACGVLGFVWGKKSK